jgi:FkbM family methyltransferase
MVITELRALARRMGITACLVRAYRQWQSGAGHSAYEARFDAALMRAIRPGDVVWDIGANIGLYTIRFSEAVGPHGLVLAFEPTPACFAELGRVTAAHENVVIVNRALGDRTGRSLMSIANDPLAATHSLVTRAGPSTVNVEVIRGDDLVSQGSPPPNVVKIDVEGFEEEVLEGLRNVLASLYCRAVMCEVHFGILDQRGRRQAPIRICRLLSQYGYDVHWVDASHLSATRIS